MTIPIGTFSQKMNCQLAPWVMAPPRSGPRATARPLMAPQTPSAAPRLAGGTAAVRIVRESGSTAAPPTPCTARAATSAPVEGASAAAALASVNRPTPPTKTRRRPSRSPSAAAGSSSTAKVRV